MSEYKLALKLDDWCEYIRKYLCLTVKDIRELKVGESIKMLFIDRNFLDIINNYTEKHNIKGEIDIENIVDSGLLYTVEYTRKNDDSLKGHTQFYGMIETTSENFEFDILFEDVGMWLPLYNDYIITDYIRDDNVKKLIGIKSNNLEDNKLIGWRGEAIAIKNIKKIPILIN